MKKLLSLLGMFAIGSTASLTVVGCNNDKSDPAAAPIELNEKTTASLIKIVKEQIAEGSHIEDINKDLTLTKFFNLDNSDNDKNFVKVNLLDKVEADLKDQIKDPNQLQTEMGKVKEWSKTAIGLVYVDKKADPTFTNANQEIKDKIELTDANKGESLETVLLSYVNKYHEDFKDLTDEEKAEWWNEEDHKLINLAVQFKVEERGVALPGIEEARSFLTFTFKADEDPEQNN